MAQDASQVREAIEQDRAELAETVQALARKADVKGRVKESVSKGTEQLQHKAEELTERVKQVTPDDAQAGVTTAAQTVRDRPLPFAAVAMFLAGLLIGRRWGRRKQAS